MSRYTAILEWVPENLTQTIEISASDETSALEEACSIANNWASMDALPEQLDGSWRVMTLEQQYAQYFGFSESSDSTYVPYVQNLQPLAYDYVPYVNYPQTTPVADSTGGYTSYVNYAGTQASASSQIGGYVRYSL